MASWSEGLTRSESVHLDEKWKLSKKDFGPSRITRSLSTSSSSSSNGKEQGRCAFTKKCARLVKEQRARFYIMRRCVVMLICWRNNYSDS